MYAVLREASMSTRQNIRRLTLVFDPGYSTGVALLSNADVVFTCTLDVDTLNKFLDVVLFIHGPDNDFIDDVVIETGPQYHHSNPLTRRVQAFLEQEFPEAHLIQPSQWKKHPASRNVPGKTQHEKDAAGLGRWFYTTRRQDVKEPRENVPSRIDATRSGH